MFDNAVLKLYVIENEFHELFLTLMAFKLEIEHRSAKTFKSVTE